MHGWFTYTSPSTFIQVLERLLYRPAVGRNVPYHLSAYADLAYRAEVHELHRHAKQTDADITNRTRGAPALIGVNNACRRRCGVND